MGSQLVCYTYARRKVVREVVKMHLVRRPLAFLCVGYRLAGDRD